MIFMGSPFCYKEMHDLHKNLDELFGELSGLQQPADPTIDVGRSELNKQQQLYRNLYRMRAKRFIGELEQALGLHELDETP